MKAVDINAARKAFDLSLPTLGPYSVDFTPNGRDLLIGGRKGHIAMIGWWDYKLVTEVQLKETVRDVKFLHMISSSRARSEYAYIYDNRGLGSLPEGPPEVNGWNFSATTFAAPSNKACCGIGTLLTESSRSIARSSVRAMRYAEPHERHHSPRPPAAPSPGVAWGARCEMLCHQGPVRSLAVDMRGVHGDVRRGLAVKTWDVRMYKIHSYYSAVPAVHVDISRGGMLGVGYGGRVQIWDQA